MDEAVAYKHLHPETSLRTLETLFGVPKSKLGDRLKGTHDAPGVRSSGHLSTAQSRVLIDKINHYADRGTCLAPHHLKELCYIMTGSHPGANWGTTFIQRHHDKLSSQFVQLQDIARVQSNTLQNRTAFYHLLEGVYDCYTYLPGNVYNMDETGFSLSTSRRVRRVLPRKASIKAQNRLPDDVHITVAAAISTVDAPVPPYLIYPGTNLLDEWFKQRLPSPPLIATVTDSGYASTHSHLDWLERAFDPYTRDQAKGARRLLFMDGAKVHLHVEFLEACWARAIDVIVLPANLSAIFQPLDVKFFNILKHRYEQQIDEVQLATEVTRLPKGIFYQFLQKAWAYTVNNTTIRHAWSESGIWPLSAADMRVAAGAPDRTITVTLPLTPQNIRMIRRIKSQAKVGEISYEMALDKTAKSLEKVLAEKALLEVEQEKRKVANELLEAARGKGKRTKHAHGQVFDQKYEEDHAGELAERKEKEEKAKKARARTSLSNRKGKRPALDTEETAGPSTTVPEE